MVRRRVALAAAARGVLGSWAALYGAGAPSAAARGLRSAFAQTVQPLRPGVPAALNVPAAAVSAPVEPIWLVPADAPAGGGAGGAGGAGGTGSADQLLAGGIGGAQIALPSDAQVVGWFVLSAVPGRAGSTLLVGHLDTITGPAVFARLDRVRPGDAITVALAEGGAVTYVAEGIWRLPANQATPPELFTLHGPPRLYLLTCYGAFVRSAGGYQDRLVVSAIPLALPGPAPSPGSTASLQPEPLPEPQVSAASGEPEHPEYREPSVDEPEPPAPPSGGE